MRLSISIIATYSSIEQARDARVQLSHSIDNLSIKKFNDVFQLIRYEINSPVDALDTTVEDTPGHYRNPLKSWKRKGSKSDVPQIQFD